MHTLNYPTKHSISQSDMDDLRIAFRILAQMTLRRLQVERGQMGQADAYASVSLPTIIAQNQSPVEKSPCFQEQLQ